MKKIIMTVFILSLSVFSQTSFDVEVNDKNITMGLMNVYKSGLRGSVLTARSGTSNDCTALIDNDGTQENFNGVLTEKALTCRAYRGVDNDVYLELEGMVQISVENYVGISGDVRVFSALSHSSGSIMIDPHIFNMSAANSSQNHWIKFRYIRSWPTIAEAHSKQDPVLLNSSIDFSIEFIATETEPVTPPGA